MEIAQDITDDVTNFATVAWAWLVEFAPRFLTAILILVLGLLLARYISRGIANLLDRTGRLERTIKPIIRAVVRYAIGIMVIVAALGQLGVQTASLLAAIGAAGIAIGLALQGTLSNIAAGIMLLWLRPFRAGDSIEVGAISGTVEEVGLFNARIRTGDGLFRFAPNSELWAKTITNFSRYPTRQVTVPFSVAYEANLSSAKAILLDVAGSNLKVLKTPPPQVVPQSLAASAIVLELRVWANNTDYDATRWDLIEGGRTALEKAGLKVPFPQTVIHFADPSVRLSDLPGPVPRVAPPNRNAVHVEGLTNVASHGNGDG